MFALEEGSKNGEGTLEPIPHGTACVLPELIGRAVLCRTPSRVTPFILAHEMGHVLAYKHGLDSHNEDLADKLGLQLMGMKSPPPGY